MFLKIEKIRINKLLPSFSLLIIIYRISENIRFKIRFSKNSHESFNKTYNSQIFLKKQAMTISEKEI